MIEIIPAIDIIDGKCVRLSQGDYAQKKIYNENPLEVAKQFESAGIERLHLVDLDGAKKGTLVNQKVLETIASKTKLVIDFGGGIKTNTGIQCVFNAGATIDTIGSLAVKDPELFFLWRKKYGSDKILLGADVSPGPKGGSRATALKGEIHHPSPDYHLTINGWIEQTEIKVVDFIRKNFEMGVKNIFCTDISKDGMLQGASIKLYKEIVDLFKLPLGQGALNLIASGGISSIKDIEAVQQAGCSGVIIGKAIYEGNISLTNLQPYIS